MDRPEFAGFEAIWFDDFEFIPRPGGHPDVICQCAYEIRTGQRLQLWEDQLGARPPHRTDGRTLFVCFVATAECACHLSLGWPLPSQVLDLSPVFRCYINGRDAPPEGKGLIGALRYFGLDTVGSKYKEAMRKRILQGRPFSPDEIAQILEYCMSDVVGLPALPKRCCRTSTWIPCCTGENSPRCRRRWDIAASRSTWRSANLLLSKEAWAFVRDAIVPRINAQYGVYVQDSAGEWHFDIGAVRSLLRSRRHRWPRHEAGKLDLRDKTFDSMAKAFPETEFAAPAAPYPQQDATGSSWRSVTTGVIGPCCGRSRGKPPAPSRKPRSGFFSPAVWMRSLIKPAPGRAIAYIDWSGWNFRLRRRCPTVGRCSTCTLPAVPISDLPSGSMRPRQMQPRSPTRTFTNVTRSAASAPNTACSM